MWGCLFFNNLNPADIYLCQWFIRFSIYVLRVKHSWGIMVNSNFFFHLLPPPLFFFWGGPYLKSLWNFLQCCFYCLNVLVFWPWSMWDLNYQTKDQTRHPALEGEILTTGPPGKSPIFYSFKANWLEYKSSHTYTKDYIDNHCVP